MKFTRIVLPVLAAALISPTASAAEETWKSIGTGLFRENFMHSWYIYSDFPEVEVEVMESEQTPGRYRIMNPYANYPDYIGSPGCQEGDWYITVDASDPVHCYIETSKTGYIAGEDQMLIVGSVADDYYNNRYGNWELADKENVCGKLVDGSITFPPMSLLGSLWDLSEPWSDDIISVRCDQKGMFRIKLPGAPNLDVVGNLMGISDDNTQLNFEVALGKSVEKARVALVERDNAESAVEGIVNGTIQSVEISESGVVAVPYTGDGFYTLFVVPYYEGTPREAFKRDMEIAFDTSVWRKAGTATYKERLISDCGELIPYGFVYNKYDYDVEVEENVERPGYIRLVDAYGPASPLTAGYKYDESRRWYIYIDASNPDEVVLEHAAGLGVDMSYGSMEVWSKADRCLNDPNYFFQGREEAIKQGFFGRFLNDEITFPKGSLCFKVANINPTGWYETNSSGEFSVKFTPGQIYGQQSGIESVAVDSTDAPAEYFRIDGTQVSADRLVPGVYIVRQGKNVSKTIIR